MDNIENNSCSYGIKNDGPIEFTDEIKWLINIGDNLKKADHDYKAGGLCQKYIITKANGDPIDKNAEYFVLRIDADKHARHAIIAYANSVAIENQQLADELIALAEHYSK